MGGGASNLSSEQILAVTKALKEKIDAMPSDLNGTSIQQSSVDEVIKLYTDTLETFNQGPEVKKCSPGFLQQFLAPLPEQSPKISKENASKKSELSLRMSASLPHYAQNITRSTRRSIDLSVKSPVSSNGRRRSFAVNPAKKRRMSTATLSVDSDTVNKAISDLVLSSAPSIDANDFSEQQPPIDSWESVSQQPFCTICQMTFKSMAFLDRHTKYSDIHAKTLAKSQQTNTESLNNAMAQPSIQEEGVHYQLLYHGTKFFWKQQKSIDFDIYLHILPNVYEVVAFDVEKHRELSRLYLDSVSVDQIIEQTLQEAVAEKRKELSKDRFKVLPTELELRNELKRNIIITNILQRLQLHSDIASKMFEIGLVFVLQSDDACVNNPALDRPPTVLIPVAGLTRRRKSTTSEINSAIAGLHTNNQEMSEYLAKASKLLRQPTTKFEVKADSIAKLIFDAVQYLRAEKWWSKLNRVRQRWIRSIRLVIRRKTVADIRARLDNNGLKKQFKRMGTLRRGPSMRAQDW